MKAHTNNFKEEIKEFGRQLDSKITYYIDGEQKELGTEELNSITPIFKGSILKSVMKELDIDSNIDIPIGTVINYKFGLKINEEFEYLNFGNYIVYSSEKQENINSYKIVCYDKMLNSMVDYNSKNIVYPITIRNYIANICSKLNMTFANLNDEFANYDKVLNNDVYDGIGYTFRDVLDELAQVTGSTICINENDELEIRYINDTHDTIDEEYFKDINVNFNKMYGPINSIVLSRAGGSDNVFIQDAESVRENGVNEIKISDNQIMNFNNRSDYLPDLLNALGGLQYYINDFSSTGICYYDLCDRYNVSIGDNTYSCVMFNDEINITQGLEENIYTELPEESETDYKKADKTDRKINQAYIIVDKQNQEIESLSKKVIPVSNTIVGNGSIKLEDAYEGVLHNLTIKGNISLLFPSNNLFPNNNLFGLNTNLIVDENIYKLDFDYLRYMTSSVYDEYIYEDGHQKIIRRVGIDQYGEMYELAIPIIEEKKDIIINIKKESTIKLQCFSDVQISCTYLLENEYTDNFATSVDLISRINLSPEKVQIEGRKISLEGKEIDLTSDLINIKSNNFNVDTEGNMTCSSATITNGIITSPNFNVDENGNVNCTNALMTGATISGGNISLVSQGTTSKFTITDTQDSNAKWEQSARIIKWHGVGNSYMEFANYLSGSCYIGLRASDNTTTSITPYAVTPGSKEEWKKDIKPFTNALDEIKSTDIYEYHYNAEEENTKKHIGLVIGETRNYSKKMTSNDESGVDLYSTISICLQAIKEQQEIIEQLQNKIEKLESESEK